MRTKSVGVLLLDADKVLLVKHTEKARHQTGAYGFPAGRVEVVTNETEIHAASRELYEETGLQISESDLLEFPENYVESTLAMKQGPEDFSYRVFLGKNWSGDIRPSEENIPEWIEIDKLSSLKLTSSNIINFVNSGLKFQNERK